MSLSLIDHAKHDPYFFQATRINFVGGLTVEPEQNTHDNFLNPHMPFKMMRFALCIYAGYPG